MLWGIDRARDYKSRIIESCLSVMNPLGRDAIVIIAKKHLDKTWVFAVNTVMDPITAKITIPVDSIFSALWDTTAMMIRQMAMTEIIGRILTKGSVYLPRTRLIRRPRTMGMITT